MTDRRGSRQRSRRRSRDRSRGRSRDRDRTKRRRTDVNETPAFDPDAIRKALEQAEHKSKSTDDAKSQQVSHSLNQMSYEEAKKYRETEKMEKQIREKVTLTRPARRLYCGNLPVGFGLTDVLIKDFFNRTIKDLRINTAENPVIAVYMKHLEAHFCFVEFRSCRDAIKCCPLLHGSVFAGYKLKVCHSADFKEPPDDLVNFVVPREHFPPPPVIPPAPEGSNPLDDLIELPISPLIDANTLLESLQQKSINDSVALATDADNKSGDLSHAVLLVNIVSSTDICNQDECEDISEDILELCQMHDISLPQAINIPKPPSQEAGSISVRFASAEEAQRAANIFQSHAFDGKPIQIDCRQSYG